LCGPDGQSNRLTFEAFNGQPAAVFRRANGTGAAPSGALATNNLGLLNFQGWIPGVGWSGNSATINGVAAENWTATANGTQIIFQTTAIGQAWTASATRATIAQGMYVGTPPDGDLGPGTLNVSNMLQVNMNAAAAVGGAASGWGVHVLGADGGVPRYLIDGFGVIGRFDFRRTNGTNAAPAGINSGDQLGVVGWFGYVPAPTSAMSGVKAGVLAIAAETWGATNQGTNLAFGTTPIGSTTINNSQMVLDSGGNLTILGATATKPGGGSWIAPSSLAVKKNVENYTRGLAELRHLQPISFEYNGELGTIADGKRYVGITAEAVRDLMPEMLSLATVTRYHAKGEDDIEAVEHDSVMLDPTALTYALVNAVYELVERLEVLEASSSSSIH
jgi:hypothetical protein